MKERIRTSSIPASYNASTVDPLAAAPLATAEDAAPPKTLHTHA